MSWLDDARELGMQISDLGVPAVDETLRHNAQSYLDQVQVRLAALGSLMSLTSPSDITENSTNADVDSTVDNSTNIPVSTSGQGTELEPPSPPTQAEADEAWSCLIALSGSADVAEQTEPSSGQCILQALDHERSEDCEMHCPPDCDPLWLDHVVDRFRKRGGNF